jgi:hypothetical protein
MLSYQTPETVYWGKSGRESATGSLSGSAAEKLMHTLGPEVTIVDYPNPRGSGRLKSARALEVCNHSENLTFQVAQKQGHLRTTQG